MLPIRSHVWRLCAQQACQEENRLSLSGDRLSARSWLLPFTNDALKMAGMRALLAQVTARHVSRMSHEAVVDAIADLLARGRLHVHAEPVEAVQVRTAVPPPPPPFPFSERMPRAPAMPFHAALPIDLPTFPLDIDLGLQAATLLAAASSGAPFCLL